MKWIKQIIVPVVSEIWLARQNNKFRNFFLDKSLRPSRYLVPVLSLGKINPGNFGNSFHTCLSIGNVFSYVSG